MCEAQVEGRWCTDHPGRLHLTSQCIYFSTITSFTDDRVMKSKSHN